MKSMKGKIFLFFAVLTVCILLGLRLWVDKKNTICIVSFPSGIEVFYGGKSIGTTPICLEKKFFSEENIDIEKGASGIFVGSENGVFIKSNYFDKNKWFRFKPIENVENYRIKDGYAQLYGFGVNDSQISVVLVNDKTAFQNLQTIQYIYEDKKN